MSAATVYQCYKTLARLIEFQADPDAIKQQERFTRSVVGSAVARVSTERLDAMERVLYRLSSRAIRVARRELANAR